MITPYAKLDELHGVQATGQLATAYEAVLLLISAGQWGSMPDRATRLAIVQAMLAEGKRKGFDPDRLTTVGLAAAAA